MTCGANMVAAAGGPVNSIHAGPRGSCSPRSPLRGHPAICYHRGAVGFFDRFLPKAKREGRLAKEAHERELAGDLGAAVSLYNEAGMHDDAARVLLLRADADPSAEKRMAFCALAAETAADA